MQAGEAEAEEVAGKDGLAEGLFGGGIACAADHGSGLGHSLWIHGFGSPKIHQHQGPIIRRRDDVGGFDVAVDDLVIVDKLQYGQQVAQQAANLGFFQRRIQLVEVGARDVLLHQKLALVGIQGF